MKKSFAFSLKFCLLSLLIVTLLAASGCSSSFWLPAPYSPSPLATVSPDTTSDVPTELPPSASPSQPPSQTSEVSGALEVCVIDVGHGDFISVRSPSGKMMIIDSGDVTASSAVKTYIRKNNIINVDVLIASHPHADHIANMDYIIKNCNIGAFYMPDKSHSTDFYTDMLDALSKKDIKAQQARAGVTVPFDDQLTCRFLAPSGSSYKDLNDYSAVLKITYGGTSFLLEADAESVSEREMVRQYGDQLRSDVLKVGHHGNDSSSTDAFLKRVYPKYSVISMADISQYDKPEKMKSFMTRFTKNGGQLFRTDINGDVTFISDGTTIAVKTEK